MTKPNQFQITLCVLCASVVKKPPKGGVISCLLLLAILVSSLSAGGKCATGRRFEELKSIREAAAAGGFSAKAALPAAPVAVRTMVTEHFAVHYTLRGEHQVRIDPDTPADGDLLSTFNSIRNGLPDGQSDYQKDAAAYQEMDDQGAKHPVFIQKQGEYFELARAHYVDELGMNVPVSNDESTIFSASPVPGKYHIEIGHIAAALPGYTGEIYALTFQPHEGASILMENDFLFTPSGGGPLDTIHSYYRSITPNMIKNYSLLWEEGIKVTASHEFYHSIQYAYTPSPWGYHNWYESSATSMEERLAPEVNDYLQYLPDLFRNHNSFSLASPACCENETYGQGIWLTFLTEELGYAFDVRVWEYLEDNNVINDALRSVFEEYDAGISDLYARFTQPLMYSQRADQSPFTSFSEDLDVWPVLNPRELPLDRPLEFSLPPLTFEVLEPENTGGPIHKIVNISSGAGLTLTSIVNGVPSVQTVSDSAAEISLTADGSGGADNLILFSNGSLTGTARISIEAAPIVYGPDLSVYPNPVRLDNSLSSLLFTRPQNADSLTSVTIYSEYGATVRTLELDIADYSWAWDLRDENSNQIAPGVYYYKAAGQPVKVLLALHGAVD